MRLCPQCGHRSDARICPEDGLPTVVEGILRGHDADSEAFVGKVFGERFEVEALLGAGGMGWVFRARHLTLQRTVALKVMRRELASDLSAVRRFYQEARASSLLQHHHTIRVTDFGVSDDGHPYLVMEYLEGRPLDDVLRDEAPLAPLRAIRIATQVCQSLDEAHSRGLVHRDLKPPNIYLARIHRDDEHVKVLDFGIAKFVAGEPGAESLTQSGMVIGSPRYISPEQAQSLPLDGRADLYALGIVLHEMLVGRPPFTAGTPATLLVDHVTAAPPPVPERVGGCAVPGALRALVSQLLAKDPADRPPSALAVARTLHDIARRDLGGVSTLEAVAREGTPPPGPRETPPPPGATTTRDVIAVGARHRTRAWAPWAAVGLGAALLGALLAWPFGSGDGDAVTREGRSPDLAATAPAPAPAPTAAAPLPGAADVPAGMAIAAGSAPAVAGPDALPPVPAGPDAAGPDAVGPDAGDAGDADAGSAPRVEDEDAVGAARGVPREVDRRARRHRPTRPKDDRPGRGDGAGTRPAADEGRPTPPKDEPFRVKLY